MPEGEEEEQEIEHLFEQIMKENLVKEIDFQEVQEAQRVPKKLNPKRNTPGTSPLSYPRLKIENLKSSKSKGKSYLIKECP